ncbi:MAG: hypothetical protein J6038_00310 [Bacilli bacterium]|nr:hypothetical protein [Bacilli bacterium]
MFDQRNYVNGFIKEHYRTYKVRVKNEDVVTLAALSKVSNFNQYVLGLIAEDIQRRREYPFIDNRIVIDFELSKTMKDLVDEAEKADILGDYGLYMNLADAIDSQGKKEASKHIISESQWRKLTRRYHL